MSRTNLSILLATGLLGVLLWMVDSIVAKYTLMDDGRGMAPVKDSPGTPKTKPDTQTLAVIETVAAPLKPAQPNPAIGGPRMQSVADLATFLNGLGLDASTAIRKSQTWFDQRGFLGPAELYGRKAESSPARRYKDYDDATLLALAGPGDLGALQALAAKSMEFDPAEAYHWYRQAASYGSVESMLNIGLLLNRWTRSGEDFEANPNYRDKVEALLESIADAKELGLTWIFAAARTGGLPVLRSPHIVALLQNPSPGVGYEVIETACQQSAKLVLELAAERRARGQIIFAQEPPPVFLGAQNLNELLRCQEQVVPIVDTSFCAAQPVTPRLDWPATLWICPDP